VQEKQEFLLPTGCLVEKTQRFPFPELCCSGQTQVFPSNRVLVEQNIMPYSSFSLASSQRMEKNSLPLDFEFVWSPGTTMMLSDSWILP
jgi:hypothetical protein